MNALFLSWVVLTLWTVAALVVWVVWSNNRRALPLFWEIVEVPDETTVVEENRRYVVGDPPLFLLKEVDPPDPGYRFDPPDTPYLGEAPFLAGEEVFPCVCCPYNPECHDDCGLA
jgi:hypothetical protein